MRENIQKLEAEAGAGIQKAVSLEELQKLRVHYLGKKGQVTELLHSLKDLSIEEKKEIGALVNALRDKIESFIAQKSDQLASSDSQTLKNRVDITLPAALPPTGRLHPLTQILLEMQEFFEALGFEVAEGPEIETDYYNFEALNIPAHHPARDLWDTFYLSENLLLRTHTSPVQIHFMEKKKPPFRLIVPGRCYRRDQVDASHLPIFHQLEGLVVDRDIQFSHLKGVLEAFVHHMFGKHRAVRFLPSFFPFTEPSAEMGVEWESGWLEIMGCGMVHPKVLSRMGIDPEQWSGFAFGMGIDRITMLKYGIPDMRLLFENHKLFLKQF